MAAGASDSSEGRRKVPGFALPGSSEDSEVGILPYLGSGEEGDGDSSEGEAGRWGPRCPCGSGLSTHWPQLPVGGYYLASHKLFGLASPLGYLSLDLTSPFGF